VKLSGEDWSCYSIRDSNKIESVGSKNARVIIILLRK